MKNAAKSRFFKSKIHINWDNIVKELKEAK